MRFLPSRNADPVVSPAGRPRSFLASRSLTVPNLFVRTAQAKDSNQVAPPESCQAKDADEQLEEPPSPSICHSPTWSLSPEEKDRKTEKQISKDRRKQEERTQKEEKKRMSLLNKAGRRLSKRPPLAMETQRSSAGLIRPAESVLSTSPGLDSHSESRPSTRDGKSSATSFTSTKRSSAGPGPTLLSQPSSPAEVPEKASQKTEVPATNQRTRRSSYAAGSRSSSRGIDKRTTDHTEPVNSRLGPRRESHSDAGTPKASRLPSLHPPSQPWATITPPSSRHSEDPDVDAFETPQEVLYSELLAQLNASGSAAMGSQGLEGAEDHGPSPTSPRHLSYRSRIFDSTQRPPTVFEIPQRTHAMSSRAPPPDPAVLNQSYVQKQRVSRQEMYMAGYQDEMAVAKATEMLQMEAARMPPTPDVSSESLQVDLIEPGRTASKSSDARREDVAPSRPPWLQESLRSMTDPEVHTRASKVAASPLAPTGPPPKSALRKPSPPSQHQDSGYDDDRHPATNSSRPAQGCNAGPSQASSPEVVVEGVSGDGIVRRTSVKRPRSDPELLAATAVPEDSPSALPTTDFLPQLKHQPLNKPKRRSLQPQPKPPRVSFALGATLPSASSGPKAPPSPKSKSKAPRGEGASLNPAVGTSVTLPQPPPHKGVARGTALPAKPVAKMFVICCVCKFWHDLPSALYAAMALPRPILRRSDGVAVAPPPEHGTTTSPATTASSSARATPAGEKSAVVQGAVHTTVRCPWCAHQMSTACCAGWTTIVYLHERHH